MPIKNPQVIGALPDAPNPADRSTFNTLAYPWSAALAPWTTEVNQIAQDTFENAQVATDEAVAADASSLLAKDWATSDSEIEAGLKSSKSYALDSAQSASESESDAALALGYKNAAYDSKNAAALSAVDANDAKSLAESARDTAQSYAEDAAESAAEAADVILGQVFDDTQERSDRGWTSSKIVAWFSGLSTAFSRTLLSRSNAADMRTDLELGTSYGSNLVQAPGVSDTDVMSQKSVTDAINARGFADASGILTATSGALSSDMSSFLSSNTFDEMAQKVGAVPLGFGALFVSPLVIAEGPEGRAYLKSGYLVPSDQAPNVPEYLYVKTVEFEGRTIPAGTYNSVTYDNGLFVAVGSVCATSPDGITWTSRTIPAGTYYSITYGNGLFVAVGAIGSGSVCATSPDGITWTSRTIPTGTYRSITYGNGLFVAVGSNLCATSPDGITWTSRTIPAGTYYSITYGNGLFVAVGDSSLCATSPDGITWTSRTIPTGTYNSVTYDNGLFVAVGSVCATSPDGITWTSRTIPAGTYYSITYGNGLFVAVGSVCATSPDGITWTSRTIPTGTYNSVTYDNGLFVAVGDSSLCATSPLLFFAGFEEYQPYLYMRIS